MSEKKFIIHSMKVEDENGLTITLDFDRNLLSPVSPPMVSPEVLMHFWFRAGLFVAGGTTALSDFWKNAEQS